MNKSLRAKLEKIQVLPKTDINLTHEVFACLTKNDRHAMATANYTIYRGAYGPGNRAIFIRSPWQLGLGENSLYLQRLNPAYDTNWNLDVVSSFIKCDSDIKAFVKDLRDATRAEETGAKKAAKDLGTPFDKSKIMLTTNDIILTIEKAFKFYETTSPIPLDELLGFSAEEVDELIRLYLQQGYAYDERIMDWAIAGLIRFPKNPKYKRLVRYRDHSLIIKNHKAGVSTLSHLIGLNVDSITEKSIEGYADAQGNFFPSPVLHNQYGNVSFDEFRLFPENVLSKMFPYFEIGIYNTIKASRSISNIGAARLNFISNPKPSNGGCSSSIVAFIECINKLTDLPAPAFSRLGRIIYNTKLTTAVKQKNSLPKDQQEKVNAIAESLLEICSKKFAEIFESEDCWLDQEIPEYSEQVESFMKRVDLLDLQMWKAHPDAYRHIRGGALAEAIILNLYDVLHCEKVEDCLPAIQETAEERLRVICADNLKSLVNVSMGIQDLTPKELIKEKIELLPKYLKAVVLSYAKATKRFENEVTIPINLLEKDFDSFSDEEKKDLFSPRYISWKHCLDELKNSARIQKHIGRLGILLVHKADEGLCLISNKELGQRILESFLLSLQVGPMGPEGPESQANADQTDPADPADLGRGGKADNQNILKAMILKECEQNKSKDSPEPKFDAFSIEYLCQEYQMPTAIMKELNSLAAEGLIQEGADGEKEEYIVKKKWW